MGQRLDEAQVHGEAWIEEVGEPDPASLGHQPEQGSVAVERPGGASAVQGQLGFLGSVDDLLVDSAGVSPEREDHAP